jgi:hypothetical protein
MSGDSCDWLPRSIVDSGQSASCNNNLADKEFVATDFNPQADRAIFSQDTW